jgi:hypothetical protein
MTGENVGENGSNRLADAVERLERTEHSLEQVRAEEACLVAEEKREIEVIEELEREHVEIHVVHVNEVEKASFKEKIKATLQQVWDKSYEKLKLEPQPKDVFQTGGEHPKSLMSDLSLTLEQAKERKVIENYHFGIASETGGA